MAAKVFDVEIEWETKYGDQRFDGRIELDQRILDAVDDDWRANLYKLYTDQDIAEHIAYNFVANDTKRVQELDGWADQPEDVIARLV